MSFKRESGIPQGSCGVVHSFTQCLLPVWALHSAYLYWPIATLPQICHFYPRYLQSCTINSSNMTCCPSLSSMPSGSDCSCWLLLRSQVFYNFSISTSGHPLANNNFQNWLLITSCEFTNGIKPFSLPFQNYYLRLKSIMSGMWMYKLLTSVIDSSLHHKGKSIPTVREAPSNLAWYYQSKQSHVE